MLVCLFQNVSTEGKVKNTRKEEALRANCILIYVPLSIRHQSRALISLLFSNGEILRAIDPTLVWP